MYLTSTKKGFTLVELAIVLVVIAFLWGWLSKANPLQMPQDKGRHQ